MLNQVFRLFGMSISTSNPNDPGLQPTVTSVSTDLLISEEKHRPEVLAKASAPFTPSTCSTSEDKHPSESPATISSEVLSLPNLNTGPLETTVKTEEIKLTQMDQVAPTKPVASVHISGGITGRSSTVLSNHACSPDDSKVVTSAASYLFRRILRRPGCRMTKLSPFSIASQAWQMKIS